MASASTAHRTSEASTRRLSRSQILWIVGASLFVAGVLLIAGNAAHMLNAHPFFSSPAWDGNLDGSLIESFGYIQLGAAAVALLFLWSSSGVGIYGAWALVLATLAADDLLMLHEYGGFYLTGLLELQPAAGLRAQDFGELIVWAVMGLVLGTVLLIAHLRASKAHRRNSLLIFALVALLAVFAVGFDILSVLILGEAFSEQYHGALTLMETTGELFVMTLILLAALRLALPADRGAVRKREAA